MSVPLLDLKLQYHTLQAEIEEAMLRVARSQICILGPEVDALEAELTTYLDVKHAIGVSSGTDALIIAFMALDIDAGDEVIVPTFSFFATAGCVSRVGATPVFVDVDPVSFNMDPDAVRRAITPRTKAIVPVHLFGQAAAMDELLAIANEHNIPVIEDAAQAIGTTYRDGRKVGGLGVMGCFSFYPTKNLGAFGDAGLVTTNDDDLAATLRQLRNHGMEPRYYHSMIGGNFRLDALQAAVLRVKLPHLDAWHAGREHNAGLYERAFIEAGLASGAGRTAFSADDVVLLPEAVNHTEDSGPHHHIFNQYTIRVQNRDAMREHLRAKGIGTEVYYPVPFHKQECFSHIKGYGESFPVADALAESVLALPIFPELTQEQISEVVETIAEFERMHAAEDA
jgi:dTDP-4-amino-4,6-dideoxygalactose transaminase